MEKSISYLLGIVLLLVTFCGCKKEEVTKVTKLEFTAGSYTISEREDMNMRKVLVFETQPAEAAESQKIVWSLSDESVAEMNGNFLTPKKAGSVIVTATVMGVSDQCEVVIEPIAITKITLSQTGEKNLFIGQSVITSIQVEPSDANIENVALSYDGNIVDVQKLKNGEYKITAKAEGKTTFKASYGSVQAQFEVESAVNEILSLQLTASNVIFVTEGVKTKLQPKITCTNNNYPPTYPKLIWQKGNVPSGSIELDADGNLTAGPSTLGFISVSYARNPEVTAAAMVVSKAPQTLSDFTIKAENTAPLWNEEFNVVIESYSPEGADLSKIVWTTSSKDVVLVGTGVNGDGKGYASFTSIFKSGNKDRYVTIYAKDGDLVKSVAVTVTKPTPTSFKVSPSKSVVRIPEGQTSVSFFSNVEFQPENLLDAQNEFTFSAEKFTSAGSSSATTDIEFGSAKSTGDMVYALTTCKSTVGGLYKITATASDGRKSECTVTVIPDIKQDNLRQWFVISDHIGCFINGEFNPTVSFKEGLYYGENSIKIVSKKSLNELVCKPSTDGKFYYVLLEDIGYIGTTEVEVRFRLLDESKEYVMNCGVVNQCKDLVFNIRNLYPKEELNLQPRKIEGTANEYNLTGQGPAWLNSITATLSDGSSFNLDENTEFETAQTVNIDGKEALVYIYKDGTSTRKSSHIWVKGYGSGNSIKIYYKY